MILRRFFLYFWDLSINVLDVEKQSRLSIKLFVTWPLRKWRKSEISDFYLFIPFRWLGFKKVGKMIAI